MKNFSITALFLAMSLSASHSATSLSLDLEILASMPVKSLKLRMEIYSSGTNDESPQEAALEVSPLRKGHLPLTFCIRRPCSFQITEIEFFCHVIFFNNKELSLRRTLGDFKRLCIFIENDSPEEASLRFSQWPRAWQKVYSGGLSIPPHHP
jgi:hypothetical protein